MGIGSFLRTLRELVVGSRTERPVRPPRPVRRPVRNPRIWAASLQTRATTPFTPPPPPEPPVEPPPPPPVRSPFARVAARAGRIWSPGLARRALTPPGVVIDDIENDLDILAPPPPVQVAAAAPEPEPAPEVAEAPAVVQTVVVQGEGQRYFPLTAEVGVARLLDGHFVYVDPLDEAVGAHLIARGYWESWIHQVVCDLVQPGDHVIEVGANFGVYTLAMARLVGPDGFIESFEANPGLAALVDRSVRFNGYAGRVRMIPKAASNRAGTVSFAVSRRNAGGGALSDDPTGLSEDGRLITVPAVRLDNECDVKKTRLLRMDAEGSEPLILRGATRLLKNPDLVVVMEWDVVQMRARADVPEFVAWLASMGFRFWRIQHDSTLLEIPARDMPHQTAADMVMSRTPPRGGRIAEPNE